MRMLVLLCLASCARGPLPSDSPSPDVGTVAPSSLDWSPVDTALDAAWQAAPSDVPGFSVLLWDRSGSLLYSGVRGEFDNTQRIPVASASKLVSALTLMRLVQMNDLSLDDTTGDILGWTGTSGEVSLDHLGGFVSGFQPSHRCEYNILTTLTACAETIGATPRVAEPGDLLEYGGSHLQVAGAMAERQRNQDWNDLFQDVLATPLGLTDSNLRYVALPRTALGERNPRVGGGLLASPAEYRQILALVLADGQLNGETFIAPELIDRLFQNPYTSAQTGQLPGPLDARPWRYGFGAWLECPADATECDVINSAGAFGMVPWVDRDTGYSGLISVYGDIGTTTFSLSVEQDLQPLIQDILASRN